jgi:uncharacterized protein (DUF1919 family)
MRSKLTNTSPSFLCPNCIGGILLHDLGLAFRSPTVNLMMKQPDFVKFMLDIQHYLSMELAFFEKPGYTCPCARLGDITIHFTHYANAEEAASKWNERKTRIDWRNLFVFASERDGLTKEEILRLGNLSCRGLVVFTANAYPDIPYALQIPQYASSGQIGNILKKSWKDESREYEQYFDFVKWFNEANGHPFDISNCIK